MSEWMNTGIGLILYLTVGIVLATVREWWLGRNAKESNVDLFFSCAAFWPIFFPIVGMYRLCTMAWAIGFNRNLPPLNSHDYKRKK